MLLALLIAGVASTIFWLGYKFGTDAERNYWVEQIKREERARHLTQGNTFWQK